MSYVINQSRKLLISQLKTELNYRLMMIKARMDLTQMRTQDISRQKTTIQNQELERLVEKGTENITIEDIQSIAAKTSDLDVQLDLLAIKDSNWESEMKMIESQIQSLNAEEEQIEKAIDSAVKKEFGIFSGN